MNLIVIGDVLLDINRHCITTRIAPEANIPVYNTVKTDYILGGAANVVKNLRHLTNNLEIVSVLGEDESCFRLKTMLETNEILHNLYTDGSRKTTCKTRIIRNDQIVARYDIEDTHFIDANIERKIIEYIKSKRDLNAIVFSDYGKGVLTETICKSLIEYANENDILTFVDPKPENAIKYKNCFCFKLNLSEGRLVSGKTTPREILQTIKDQIQCNHVILTCGADGMYIDDGDHHIRHKSEIDVVDVTGSGDLVLASIVYLYSMTKDIHKSCRIANYIAGKGTQIVGNYTLTSANIDEYVDDVIYDHTIDKIKTIRMIHNNIVFTNGCFDIMHSAHIRLLQFCKKQGSILVVGLNSDDSIKRLKGSSRPINSIAERCEFIMNLGIVDYIIVFDDDTPEKILSILRPNIIVKGGDYTKETVIGSEYADETIIYEYKNGLSTTNTICRINAASFSGATTQGVTPVLRI
jgi:D-beta-D-heptose 7-phosphate kinase/D-beta-D-heptose 1-phosphate adenosyltransferase